MSGDPARVIAHLRHQIDVLQNKLNWFEGQIGPANLRYVAMKDQYEAHMAEAHYEPVHAPCVAPLANGGWGVYCEGCSHGSEQFVYPCRLLDMPDQKIAIEWPPPILVGVPS